MSPEAIAASEKLNKALSALPRRESLYDIAAEIMQVHVLREEAEYEGDADRVQQLDSQLKHYLHQELPAKVDGIRNYLRWQENEAAVRTKEAEEQAILAGRAQANIDRVKDMCLWVMQQLGVKKLEGGLHWLRRQGNGGLRKVDVRQPELVPDAFQKVTAVITLKAWNTIRDLEGVELPELVFCEPWTERIRATLERGGAVPGCVLIERGEHVRTS
jgi:hypothetical protein